MIDKIIDQQREINRLSLLIEMEIQKDHLQQHNEVQEWHKLLPCAYNLRLKEFSKEWRRVKSVIYDGGDTKDVFYEKVEPPAICLLADKEFRPGMITHESYYFWYNAIFGEKPTKL